MMTTTVDMRVASPLAKRLLVLFIFITCVFSYLAYRSEVNTRAIEDNAHAQCETTNHNSANLNGLIDDIITGVKAAPSLSQAEKNVRVARYTEAKSDYLDCD